MTRNNSKKLILAVLINIDNDRIRITLTQNENQILINKLEE